MMIMIIITGVTVRDRLKTNDYTSHTLCSERLENVQHLFVSWQLLHEEQATP